MGVPDEPHVPDILDAHYAEHYAEQSAVNPSSPECNASLELTRDRNHNRGRSGMRRVRSSREDRRSGGGARFAAPACLEGHPVSCPGGRPGAGWDRCDAAVGRLRRRNLAARRQGVGVIPTRERRAGSTGVVGRRAAPGAVGSPVAGPTMLAADERKM